MPFFAAAPLVSLFFFSSFAIAGIYAPDCTSTAWEWSFNSLGQNACTVAAYMMSTCNGGSFSVATLPPGYHYVGPERYQASDLCMCSPIGYSLLSACDGCQGSKWITWSEYVNNCTKTMPPGSFPNPIPAGTRLPQWALLDITNENLWNVNKSYAVGDTPELGPGTILGPSGPSGSASTGPTNTYPSTPASSSSSYSTSSVSRGSSSNSATPIPIGGHSSNTGAIAGGVAGSIAALSIVIAALLFYLRWRHSPAPSAPSASDGQPGGFNPLMDQVPRPMSGHGTVASSLPETTTSLLRVYNADDPTTYPTYQGTSPPPTYIPTQSPSLSSSRNLYTVATAPNLQGQGLGYNGIPIV